MGIQPQQGGPDPPQVFCTSSRPVTTSRKVATALPPRLRLPRSAERPMEAKKVSIRAVCRLVSNCSSICRVERSTSSTRATTRPPATGLGMLKVRRVLSC